MKLYNANIDKIEKIAPNATVKIDGANMYIVKLTDVQLNSVGYHKLSTLSEPNRRYYTSTKTSALIGGVFTTSYMTVDKDTVDIKALMVKDLFKYADKKEDEMTVSTTLGITVKGNSPALQAFTLGAKRGATTIRDENYQKHSVTVPQMNTLLNEIEDNAMAFFDTKGNKFDEIIALPDVASCIAYEKEPYDYIVTQEDIDNDIEGTLILGQIIVKYKNNVKEW